MQTYELTYIISPEITSEEAESKAKEIESAIQAKEGVILRQSNPIAKTLAYPIAKRASGFLGVLEFQLESEKLPELKNVIEKEEKIVRHIFLIKKPVKIRKERRSKIKTEPVFSIEKKMEIEPEIKEDKKEKVELKDIEQQLEELLG